MLKRLCSLVGLAVAAGGLFAAGWAFNHCRAGDRQAQANIPEPVPGSAGAVVCFGHVDLEGGITPLCPNQPGRVAEVLVKEGEEVTAGQVLLRLEDRQARARCSEAQAALAAAQSQLAQARTLAAKQQARKAQLRAGIEALQFRLSAAQRLRDHKRELVEQSLLGRKELDVAVDQALEAGALLEVERNRLRELDVEDPVLDVQRAEAEVAVMAARLRLAREVVEDCALKAPRAGTVLRVLVNPGEMLGGAPKQTALQFCAAGPRLIRAEVEQEFANRVALGQEAILHDDHRPGQTWRGRVIRISDWYTQRRSVVQEPLQVNDVRTLECLIALDPGQPPLRLGQRIRVTI